MFGGIITGYVLFAASMLFHASRGHWRKKG